MSKRFTTRSHLYPIIIGMLLLLPLAGCGTTGTSNGPTITTNSVTSMPTNSGTSPTAGATPTPTTGGTTPNGLPHFDHIVVAIEENHSFSDIIGTGSAPYIASLATQGALFTDAHGTEHPSEPNYLSLFAGSTFGLTDDTCPISVSAPDLGGELIAHSQTFTGYAEDLPSVGFSGCDSGAYARKHNPWVNFSDVPANDNQPFTAFPSDFSKLPTVAFVVPNLNNDMHDGTVGDADVWLKANLDSYIQWAKAHNSLFILTWDEDDGSNANHIVTLFVGAHVKAGQYSETINHFSVLSTIEAICGLPYMRNTSAAKAIKDVWQ